MGGQPADAWARSALRQAPGSTRSFARPAGKTLRARFGDLHRNPVDWALGDRGRYAPHIFQSPVPYPLQAPDASSESAGRRPYVSEFRFGRPIACSQWLTVMFSCVNSPVQISTPIPISTTPPVPITTG